MGISVQLEDRVCKCGCGRGFRVMPTSNQEYASQFCDDRGPSKPLGVAILSKDGWRKSEKGQARRIAEVSAKDPLEVTARKPTSNPIIGAKKPDGNPKINANTLRPEGTLPTPKRDRCKSRPRPAGEFNTEWDRLVKEAQALVLQMNRLRMQIAGLAIQACDIVHGGGGHWDGFKSQKTLTAFADQAGLSPKTLWWWVKIKRRVVDHLPEDLYDERNYGAAARTAVKVRKNETDEEIAARYQKELERQGSGSHMHIALKNMKTIWRRCKEGEIDLDNCEPEEILQLNEMVQETAEILREYTENHVRPGTREQTGELVH